MSTRPTYIVTGGAGFVGSNLVAALLRRDPDAEVIIVDDFRSGSFANVVEACERNGAGPFAGQVMPDPVGALNWDPAVASLEPTAVFHLAAITDTTVSDEGRMIADNSESFVELLHACGGRGVPLVYASSAATYGSPAEAEARTPFAPEIAGRPNNVYGFSKWLMEAEHARLDRISEAEGEMPAPVVGLRYFNVFGPGEERKGTMASMVRQLACQVLDGRAPRLFADGEQARDQVHVDDVVSCTMAAAGLGERSAPDPGVYNVGSGRATSFNAIVEAVRRALDVPAGTQETEYFEMPAAIRAFYQSWTCADISATESGLGWTPRLDPVEAIGDYARHLASEARRGGAVAMAPRTPPTPSRPAPRGLARS